MTIVQAWLEGVLRIQRIGDDVDNFVELHVDEFNYLSSNITIVRNSKLIHCSIDCVPWDDNWITYNADAHAESRREASIQSPCPRQGGTS
jgi:hypothetical protein